MLHDFLSEVHDFLSWLPLANQIAPLILWQAWLNLYTISLGEQFRRCLDQYLSVKLSDDDFSILCKKYITSQDGQVNYRVFTAQLENGIYNTVCVCVWSVCVCVCGVGVCVCGCVGV